MNELDQMMTEYKPISEPLTEEEMLKLKQKILQKSRSKRKARRLILALAAAVCLLAACGAAAIGLFDSMSDTNQTAKMVEKYSLAPENPLRAAVDGHTVTVQAILRSDNIARVIYDITGSERQLNDWTFFGDSEGRAIVRVQMLTNGQPSGHTDVLPDHENQMRQSASIGAVPESNSVRYFADLSLTEDADTVSIYVLSEGGSAEVLQAALPEPIEEKELSLPDAALSVTAEGVKIDCLLQKIRITPFRVIVEGICEGNGPYAPIEADWSGLIRLYGTDGKEIRIGKDGSFFSANGHMGDKDFSVELGSYDLLDPADVTEIEIGGVKYPVN